MIDPSGLKAVLGVNAQARCDCGNVSFEIGIAVNPSNGNNFIRLLQCTKCGGQLPATHQSDAQLAPALTNWRRKPLSTQEGVK